MTDITTTTLIDTAARVISEAIDGHIFAAGVTQAVTDLVPLVVPLADDFTEAGMPAVTVALGPWDPTLQPGNERLHVTLLCAVWRPRVPLGVNTAALYADRDAIADAWIAHTKAFGVEPALQSTILSGGPGIVPRSVPAGDRDRIFLTLPFSINCTFNRTVVPQPA